MKLVLFALALAGCSNLPPVAASVCGNGVLEAHEDCDHTGDTRCVACGWTCASDADCASVPRGDAGYRCGVDQLCHAPSGVFDSASTSQPLRVDNLFVTDVDRDGIGDAVGLSSTSAVTRAGDPLGRLATVTSSVTPDLTGLPAFADLDHDGTLDFVVPTGDGVVPFASPNHVIAPYPLGIRLPSTFPENELLALFPIDDARLGAIVNYTNTGHLLGVWFDAAHVPPRVGLLSLCETDLNPATFGHLDVHDTSSAGIRGVTIAFSATNATNASVTCVTSASVDLTGPDAKVNSSASLPIIGPASAALVATAPLACPSLVVSHADLTKLGSYPGAPASDFAANCVVAGPERVLPPIDDARPGAILIGHVALQPTAASFAADALATTNGIYGVPTGAAPRLASFYTSDRDLDTIATGDFDRDGARDAVVTHAGDRDLDVLYRFGSVPAFLRLRTGTETPPSHLVVADFDGDGADDIVFVEHLPVGDRMSAIYGDRGRAAATVEVGELYGVVAAVPAHLVASNSPENALADLVLLDRRPNELLPVFELLYGSPQRALIPFVDPEAAHDSTFYGVLAGSFRTPGGVDLAAFHIPPSNDGATASLVVMVSEATGEIDLVMPSTNTQLTGIGACGSTPSELCLDQVRLVAWPASAGHDQLVGIDPLNGRSFVYDAMVPETCGTGLAGIFPCAFATQPGPTPPGATIAFAPFPIDLNGDGDHTLIIGVSSATQGNVVESCAVTNAPTPMMCSDLLLGFPDLAGKCNGAVPGRIAPGGGAGIVLVCGTELHGFWRDTSGDHEAKLVDLPFAPTTVAVGDVTGDRVDDLLATGIYAGISTLFVYPQLSSRAVPTP